MVLMEILLEDGKQIGLNIGSNPWPDDIYTWMKETGIGVEVEVVYKKIGIPDGYQQQAYSDWYQKWFTAHPSIATGFVLSFRNDQDFLMFRMFMLDKFPSFYDLMTAETLANAASKS